MRKPSCAAGVTVLVAATTVVGCVKKHVEEPARASPTGASGDAAPSPAVGPGDAAVTASGEAPGKHSAGATADCQIWSSYFDGPYKYENNQWGFEKSKGGFEQCLLRRQREGRTQWGWTWYWPGHDPSVFAYPQIVFGWKPWSGGNPTDEHLPLRVGDAKHVVLKYAVEMEATGSYNLAPEIWLIDSGEWSAAANPKAITTEVMFWMDYQGVAQPAGSIVDQPKLAGIEYELWKMDNIGDKGDGTGWTILTFKSPTPQHRGTIDIHTLLAYLVKAKQINPDHYVASIEFGNEVMGGSGTTWVEQFEVEVEP